LVYNGADVRERQAIMRQLPYFVLILLLAAAARLLHIDAESLWVDEGFSYWAIQHDDLFGVIVNDVHPPLYFIGLRAWAEFAGITELALRFFSVIPALLSVAAIVPLAREVGQWRGQMIRWFPVIAALLLALADMETYIAQQVRMYSWHVLWVIVSMTFFLRWMQRGGRVTLGLWFIASLLLVYTHYIGLAALAAQGLIALIYLRRRVRWVALGTLMLVGVAFAPWGLVVVGNQTANIGTGFNVPSTLESLWNWRDEWFTGQWALLIGLAVFGLLPLNVSRSARVSWRSTALVLLWLILPVAGAYVLNWFTPILMDYRLTQITPAVALLVALGLMNFPTLTRVFLVAVIVFYGVAIYDTPRPRPPWRDVGQNAAQYAQPGDLALAHVTPSGDWQVIYYYDRFMPAGVERRSLRQWQLEDGETYADGLPALLREHPHVWFMHWSSDLSGFEALRATGHTQTAVMTEDWLGNDLNVYRFDRVPPAEQAIARYESGLILRDAIIYADDLRVDLWWSTAESLIRDDTISAILLDESGRVVAQDDGMPFRNNRPTSSFLPDEVVYDPHPLTLADGIDALSPGVYTVAIKTYTFIEGGIQDIPTRDGAEFAVIGTITIP
jgi:hypothetical protein